MFTFITHPSHVQTQCLQGLPWRERRKLLFFFWKDLGKVNGYGLSAGTSGKTTVGNVSSSPLVLAACHTEGNQEPMEGKGRVSDQNRCVLLDSQEPVTVFVFQELRICAHLLGPLQCGKKR